MDMSVHAAPAWPAAHEVLPGSPGRLAACVVAGLEPTGAVRQAVAEGTAAGISASLRPDAALPCSETVLRVELGSGEPFNRTGILRAAWHRLPYTLTLRIVRYDPDMAEPRILHRAVIGTRGDLADFTQHAERIAVHLLERALGGYGHEVLTTTTGEQPHPSPRGAGGRLDRARTKWADRLRSEWWSLGIASRSPQEILRTGGLGPVRWLAPDAGAAYCADPFPLPGTGKVLCEEMPMSGGHGRIVVLAESGGTFSRAGIVLETAQHHSYPCVYQENDETFLLPEATSRGGTTLYHLSASYGLTPVCAVAEGRRLADSTLFRHGDRYWIAATDLDFGSHDNLVLLYADYLGGPWQAHPAAPASIDIRGARPAGPPFRADGALFRPAQDCSATYGGGIAINRIDVLTPEVFHESLALRLLPEAGGPFPHGLHTLAGDGTRTWIDGKRFVLDWPSLRQKFNRRLRRRPAGESE